MAAGQREFDIILYGATGFAGKLTAAYLAGESEQTRIALAGRSADRVQAVRAGLGPAAQSWPVVVADASSPSTLQAMAARTRVVISTVGPYSRYGLPLVAACAAAGTDYADLTGETNFIRESIDLYHKQAVDTGARIVHSCGFDSVPSDITVFALYRRAQQDDAGDLRDTDMVVRTMRGGVSGGTIASMLDMLDATAHDPDLRDQLNDPYTLTPDAGAEPRFGEQPDVRWRRGAQIAPELGGIWTGAFAMAMPNTRIVRRSNALLDYAYGRRFVYGEQMSLGRSIFAPAAAALMTGANAAALGLGGRLATLLPRALVDRMMPKPGTGPGTRTRETGHYRLETYTATGNGSRYRATMAQRGDPGYKATALLLGQCGLSLAHDRDMLSDLCGVLTPAAAMGDVLLTRLPAAGVTLQTERLA